MIDAGHELAVVGVVSREIPVPTLPILLIRQHREIVGDVLGRVWGSTRASRFLTVDNIASTMTEKASETSSGGGPVWGAMRRQSQIGPNLVVENLDNLRPVPYHRGQTVE